MNNLGAGEVASVERHVQKQLRHFTSFNFGVKVALPLVFSTCLLAIFVSVAAVLPPKILAHSGDGYVTYSRVIPELQQLVSPEEAEQWAADSLVNILSFHFRDVEKTFGEAKSRFSKSGYRSYVENLERNGTIESLKNRGGIVTTITKRPFELLHAYRQPGSYGFFKFRAQVLTTVYGAGEPSTSSKYMVIDMRELPRGAGHHPLEIINLYGTET
ncbi:hypothetical protein A3709_19695 [Halioglobus sp. HI00S01]|uniref:DotI/IcmL/TraM family protein n=1 Tax=Halioglobus sp. HI00S01 TaxID=1822214 RepID=UPI0007C33245|nr:DotI/IcmL/TraM family protein [Halioglobus sp. HI00S01]KZX57850.1 hypothetical protein A3709_19695 [Halioglobus sp. HI00S01]